MTTPAAEANAAVATRPAVPTSEAASPSVPATTQVQAPRPAPPLMVLSAPSEKRVALVIGNARYTAAPELQNPGNDARDVAAALRSLGFQVLLGTDLDFAGFRSAVRDFSRELTDADVALFFYAGHGLQVGGKNYLVPVDARIESVSELEFDTVTVDSVLRTMEQDQRVSIVMLDACRDNPLARTLRRSLSASRSGSVGQGLAPIRTAGGTLIAFATDPDNIALDGSGTRNSPFTAALLNNIDKKGLEIESMLKRVRVEVMRTTRNRQTPWSSSSLLREVFLSEIQAPELATNSGP